MSSFCRRGHEFTEENTYLRKDGGRNCKACQKARNAAWRAKNKDKIKAKRAAEYLENKTRVLEVAYERRRRPGVRHAGIVARNEDLFGAGAWCITQEAWQEKIACDECHYCRGPLKIETGSALDRKDSRLPYTAENTVPCCLHCNNTKGKLASWLFSNMWDQLRERYPELVTSEDPWSEPCVSWMSLEPQDKPGQIANV